MTTSLSSDPVFSNVHILGTSVTTAVLSLAAAAWRLGRGAVLDAVGIAVMAGASEFLYRASANMPQLNADGLPGYSANDWLAPVLTYVFVSCYGAARPAADQRRFNQARALTTLASLVVNVVTSAAPITAPTSWAATNPGRASLPASAHPRQAARRRPSGRGERTRPRLLREYSMKTPRLYGSV